MNSNLYIKLLLFCFWYSLSFAQLEWNSKKSKITIPFELTHNLIIVDVVINDIDLKMILDTGSERNLLFSFPDNSNIEFYNPKTIKVKGLGYGENLEAIVSSKNILTLKNESLIDKNFEILLITNQNIGLINKLGIPINGIIGSSFFKDYIVELNYSRKKIFLFKNHNKTLNKKVKRFDKTNVELIQNKPYINLTITNNKSITNVNLLFDSGLGDGLWLFEDDSIKCSNNFFIDILGKGLGGDVTGKKSRVNDLQIDRFHLKDALVSYPDTISINHLELVNDRNGSLGGEINKRFNWLLDYKNSVFYFKKNKLFNEPFNYNMSGIEVQHEGLEWVQEIRRTTANATYNKLDITEHIFNDSDLKNISNYSLKSVYLVHSVRKNSPAYKSGVQEGDKIIKINGKNAYHFTIQKITDLFQSEEGKKIKLEVQREGEILEFEFYLEKIL